MITANATLITPQEVSRFANVSAQMDTAAFCNFIIDEEETLFCKYFGYTFYTDLIADLATYASVAFNTGVAYTIGQYVEFNGVVWEVVQNTTGQQIPPNKLYFAVPAKFATAANEYLWQRYLGRIIANVVVGRTALTQTVRLTEKGLGRTEGEQFKPAERGDVADYRTEINATTQQSIRSMERYILDNAASYPNYKLILDKANEACCDTKKGTKYRPNTFGFVMPDVNGSKHCDYCGGYGCAYCNCSHC
jgi:hypothetical protein